MIAGIDACKGGWLVAKSRSWPCPEKPYLAICDIILSALEFAKDCHSVAIDLPIGIPSGARIRGCDLEARELLGRAASRVFLAPPRETLDANSGDEFQELHRLYRHKGAGYPVWRIVPKLKEVDRVMTPKLQNKVREFHPELAWKRANGKLLESKHGPVGLTHRTDILRASVPDLTEVLSWKDKLGRAAAIDDVLDALIGLSVAQDTHNGSAHRLPRGNSELDQRGLRMEIWY